MGVRRRLLTFRKDITPPPLPEKGTIFFVKINTESFHPAPAYGDVVTIENRL